MRFFLSLMAILILMTGSIAGPVVAIRNPAELPAVRLAPSEDRFLSAPFVRSDEPYVPRRDDIMGDVSQAGDTYYDYQSNGSIGKMIGYDTDGNIHVTWMDGYDVENSTRHQKYNFLEDIEGAWIAGDGVACDEGTRSGYGALTLTEEETQRCIVFFHAQGGPYGDEFAWITGLDFDQGWGAFISTVLPVYNDAPVLWPRGVMSPQGRIHVVGNDLSGDVEGGRVSYMLAYINDDDEIEADLEIPLEVGITNLNTYQIARSPVSERAAIIWPNSRVGVPAPEEWSGFLAWQMNNDLFLAWTDDGDEWNFDDPLNLTDCIMPDRALDDPECYGDTLLPYATFDVIFDDDDNIHVVFEVRGLWWDPNSDEAPPLRNVDDWAYRPSLTVDASYLYHWSEETEEFNAVADGWYWHYVIEDDTIRSQPVPGAWKSNVCYPSLAYADNGDLYCVYNYYPENDFNNFVGPYGMCNGDIAVTVSEDNGETWYEPTMIVQTESHLAESGEADCEEYPTVAERVDDYLHVFWENDREAGTTIQDDNAANTNNPFFYQRVAVDDILREDILEGLPPFHVGEEEEHVGEGSEWTVSGFRLTGAYPNPFNNSTSIEFEVRQPQEVWIEAYNIAGQKVEDLYRGEVLAGHHRVNWDANGLTAGVYLVRVTAGVSTATMKVALVK